MAQELLKGTSTIRLYRHDVESLFYIMLTMGAHCKIVRTKPKAGKEAELQVVMRGGKLPYRDWFDTQDYHTLGVCKGCFFLDRRAVELSPSFEGFREWLEDLRYSFSEGFIYKVYHPSNMPEPPPWKLKRAGGLPGGVKPTPTPLDDETLGGNVDYSAIIEPIRYLKGELEGLIIRYHSPGPLLANPTGAAQPDA